MLKLRSLWSWCWEKIVELKIKLLKLTGKQCWRWDRFVELGIKLLVLTRIFIVEFCYNLATINKWPQRSFELVFFQWTGTELFTHESTCIKLIWETDLLRFEGYILIVLKDSRLSKTMKRATTVCAAECFIANINEFYGRLCGVDMLAVSLEQNNSKGHWEVKIISLAAEGT